jgi:hypothetical protein
MSADEVVVTESLWRRELRRAARRAADLLNGRIVWSCVAAASGAMAAYALSLRLTSWWMQLICVGLGAVAGFPVLWTVFFIGHACWYRLTGFRDKDWAAGHDDSASGVLFLQLVPVAGAGPDPRLVLELAVKSGGGWAVVEDRNLRWWQDNVIRCQFDLMHKLHPGGFYEVRWFRRDRARFVEITRERFQLRNHSIGALKGSPSQARASSLGLAR